MKKALYPSLFHSTSNPIAVTPQLLLHLNRS